jgi:type VI secretion system protein ImpH
MISLFYRAWERYRFTVAFERGKHDELTDDLFALVGMGTRGLRERLGLPDEALIFYGGLVAQRPHSGGAVESVLGDYFGVPARLEPFTGQWLELDEESRTRLGAANSQLGYSTVAGTRVWDAQSKFRLRFGPLKLKEFERLLPVFCQPWQPSRLSPLKRKEFERLLPASTNYGAAVSLGRLMGGAELDFDMRLVLKAEEVPDCALGESGVTRPRLGWTTWLKTQPFVAADSQVLLQGAA